MCLAAPMKVQEITGSRARCTAFGQQRWVDLTLMGEEKLHVGEYLVVHLGFAQRTIPENEALQSLELFSQIKDILQSGEAVQPTDEILRSPKPLEVLK